jgi:glycosyltransferase involved in cell wall biosynthesis
MKIKILHAIRQGSIGGGESHVLDLVAHLDPARYESEVLAFTGGAMIDRLGQMGVPTHVIPTTRPFDVRVWGQVAKLLRQRGIGLVHVHGTRANTNLLLPAKWCKLPVVYTVHGWSFHGDLPALTKKARVWSEALLTRQSNATITVSEANHQTGLAEIGGFASVTIPNGINLQRFDPQRPMPDLRPALGLAPTDVVVGYLARLTKQKEPLTMLRGFAQAVAQTGQAASPLRLLMVGDGELKADALALAQELQLGDRVVFQPFRTDVPELLRACDLFCLPSLWEGLPIGLLEAMAMALPVVATRVDGTVNLLAHRQNGLLINPKQPDELAAAITELAQQPALRQQLAQAARQTVEQHYSAHTMARRVETVYGQVLKTR